MSGYLLDTNALAMALTGDTRLPEKALERMQAADRLAVSIISFYEIGQKVRLGKWPEMVAFVDELENQARSDGYDLVPLTAKAAVMASTLDWPHRDPFDRMIAAVAMIETLPLISSDTAFDELAIERISST